MTRFGFAIAAASLLVTLVMATGIWESYYPDPDRAALAARRAYFEKSIRPAAGVSLTEARHWRAVDGPGGAGEERR